MRLLTFGSEHMYELLPFDEQFHVRKFVDLSKLHSVHLALEAPKTLNDWMSAVQIGQRSTHMGGDSYSYLWMLRAHLIAEMRASRIRGLGYNSKNTVADMRRAFPDQCQWLDRFCESKNQTIGAFLKSVQYKDSLEMFTCDACVLGDQIFRRGTLLDLQSKRSKIINAIKKSPAGSHPVEVFKQALWQWCSPVAVVAVVVEVV